MTRLVNCIFAIALLACVFSLSAASALYHGDGYFFYENRTANVILAPTADAILNGAYADAVETGLSDRIFAREKLLSLKTAADLYLFDRAGVNGLIRSDTDENGDNALLDFHGYYRWDTSYMTAAANDAVTDIAAFNDAVDSYGGRFYYVGVPQQFSYFADLYPSYADNREWNVTAMSGAFKTAMTDAGVNFVDMREIYASEGNPAEYYAADDHHYTLAGASRLVRALSDAMLEAGGADTPLREFELAPIDNPTLGSRSRKLFGMWRTTRKMLITAEDIAATIPFTRTDDGVETAPEVFMLPQTTDEYVLYDLYMGGDKAETVIDTHRPELQNALIFGDSFTNAAETLLYASFNVTRCVDLRHYTAMTISEYVQTYKPDVVICIRDETVYLDKSGNGCFE